MSVISVTDGEASHPGSPTVTLERLADLRRRESDLAAADVNVTRLERLSIPDGAVHEHEHRLAGELRDLLPTGSTVATPLSNDGHPDHEATTRAVIVAADACLARVVEYPIWMWHWAFPRAPDIAWHRAHRVDLPPEYAASKRRAASRFASQIEPLSQHPADQAVLPPDVLDRLLRDDEVILL